jgi:hypothetical protein
MFGVVILYKFDYHFFGAITNAVCDHRGAGVTTSASFESWTKFTHQFFDRSIIVEDSDQSATSSQGIWLGFCDQTLNQGTNSASLSFGSADFFMEDQTLCQIAE